MSVMGKIVRKNKAYSMILRDTEKGKGVFACETIEKNSIIFECRRGEIYTYEESRTFLCQDYFLQIGQDFFVGRSHDWADYFNHSCDPNAGLIIKRQTPVHLVFIALRQILPGEEIAWDYSTTMDEDDWEMDCLCGSPKCRGRIRDFKYLPNDIQRKYIDLEIVPEYIKRLPRGKTDAG